VEKKNEETDFGPEVHRNVIQSTLVQALSLADPLNIRERDFVHIVHSQRYLTPGGPQANIISELGINIWNFEETEDWIAYTLVEEEVRYQSDGTQKTVVFEDDIVVSKRPLNQNAASTSSLATSHLQKFAGNYSTLQPQSSPRASYHQLRVAEKTVPPPFPVQQKQGCEGLQDCKITVFEVRFNEVIWQGDSPTIYQHHYVFSGDVPYYAAVLKQCITGQVEVNSIPILVTDCREVENFRFGTPLPQP
jgi:hypothetical protein